MAEAAFALLQNFATRSAIGRESAVGRPRDKREAMVKQMTCAGAPMYNKKNKEVEYGVQDRKSWMRIGEQ